MNKTLSVIASAVVGAGAVVAVATVAAPVAHAADGDLPTGYYRAAYSDNIYDWNADTHDLDLLTPQAWEDAGHPPPIIATDTTFYARYPWSSGIVGVTFFTAPDSDSTPVYVFAGLDGAAWNMAGNPQPQVVSDSVLPGSGVVGYRSSQELFVFDATGTFHKLGYDEWTGLGTPSAVTVGEVDKYSFDPTLYLYVDASDESAASVVALTGSTWIALANPTPATAPGRLRGDSVFAFTDSPDIFLRTPTKVVQYLSFSQWSALGQPAPVRLAPPSTDAAPSTAPPAGTVAQDTATHRRAVQVLRQALGLR